MAPGRKRTNPQRIDTDDVAKRQQLSFYQHIPRDGQAGLEPSSSDSHPVIRDACPRMSGSEGSTTSNHVISNQAPFRGKNSKGRGKKSTGQVNQPIQLLPSPPTFSRETLSVLPTTDPPLTQTISIPLLHPHMPGLEVYHIQLSHAGHKDGVCIAVGKLNVTLEGIPLNRLYNECGASLCFYLESSVDSSDSLMVLRLEDGAQNVHIKVDNVHPNINFNSNCCDVVKRFLASSKCVRLFLSPISEDTPLVSKLAIDVWAMDALCEVSSSSEAVRLTSNVSSIKSLVELLHPQCVMETPCKPVSGLSSVASQINQFYVDVQSKRRERYPTRLTSFDPLTITGFSARLREYQCQAVQWMLEKEGVQQTESSNGLPPTLHKLWRELPSSGQGFQNIYFNPYSGKFSRSRFPEASWPKGGILADEMGLGKTVEILALIMTHKWPESEPTSTNVSLPESEIRPLSEAVTKEVLEPSSGGAALPSKDAWCNGDSLDVVQCLCGSTSEDVTEKEFVQCEYCLVWQHTSCVDYNSEKHGDHFYCVKCLLDKPLPSGTTLIISPQSISQQWMDEISKHTRPGAVKAYVYQGVSRKRYVSPLELSHYDVVLVSYETLRKEFYHARSYELSKTLRKRKRYTCPPSPLPALLWWRVCLDEAQMVESTSVRAAEMTMKLSAINRWCVTGTPVQKQVLDLYGLLLFLGVDPYYQSVWFSRLLWEPFCRGNWEPMVDLFARVMWRNSKHDVIDELNLPDHSEQVHWLSFTSVEAYFYQRQQETCLLNLRKVIKGLDSSSTLNSMVQATVHKLMVPLHSLRQACCHPQIVKSGSYLPVNITNKNFITMPVLLEKLTTKAKVEAREALRQLVAALNGLAAIHILKEEWQTAVQYYREAMTVWQDHSAHDVDCDKLQRIHTMENLAALLEAGSGGNDHTLRDSELREQANVLRLKYSEKVEGQVKAAAEALFVCKESIVQSEREFRWLLAELLGETLPNVEGQSVEIVGVKQQQRDLTCTGQSSKCLEVVESAHHVVDDSALSLKPVVHPSTPWWFVASKWISSGTLEKDLLDAIRIECETSGERTRCPVCYSLLHAEFRDMAGMLFFITEHMDKLQSSRHTVLSLLNKLSAQPSPELVSRASDCHLELRRREEATIRSNSEPCSVCVTEIETTKYTRYLFSQYDVGDVWAGLRTSTNSTFDHHGDGSRRPGLLERLIRTIVTFIKQNRAPPKLTDAGHTLLNNIDDLKKENAAMRNMWLSIDERLCTYDELNMASTRLRFMTPVEILTTREIPYAINPCNVPHEVIQFTADRTTAETDLKKCLGRVLYLQNLAKMQDKSGTNCELCPVCTRVLGREWAMFSCGHSLCVNCTSVIIRRQPRAHYQATVTVKCVICREPTLSSDIHFIKDTVESDLPPVTGCHSTKVVAVIRALLNISQAEPGVKCLVFSMWLEVLHLIANALVENGIEYRFLRMKKTFEANLTEFKSSKNINILLLPFHSGSKGLNIVEASHVFLVEPVLNMGVELQAVGRVQRMGQTRPTKVHHFCVRDTVEEKIYSLHNSQADKTKLLSNRESESQLTVLDIQNLFDCS